MSDKPILFSGPMVRALLDGRKTMTRRLALTSRKLKEESTATSYRSSTKILASPWQRVMQGNRLWVRESLTHVTSDPVTADDCSLHCYSASIPAGMTSANPYEPNYLFPEDGKPSLSPKSIPSIHMPRWASRLTLAVTAVKTERLQDISEEDAWAEGVCSFTESTDRPGSWDGLADADRREMTRVTFGSAAKAFNCLFDQLHGPEVWNSNPEVVAISFDVIKSNIDSANAPVSA